MERDHLERASSRDLVAPFPSSVLVPADRARAARWDRASRLA